MWDFPLFPEQASTVAHRIDLIYFVLIGLAVFFAVGVAGTMLYFIVKYRHTSRADRSHYVAHTTAIEATWIVLPLLLSMGMFGWAATVYFDVKEAPPGDALEVYGVGKQWMWKFQHPNGAREINTLHVPTGQAVKMIMTSQDVIHSFYVPAFRVKQDVLPDRYTDVWFEATKPGRYHLFCTEYCGTEHARMRGYVYVMEPAAYAEWLRLGETGGSDSEPGAGPYERTPTGTADAPFSAGPGGTEPPQGRVASPEAGAEAHMAVVGAALFRQLRCDACHRVDSTALYPAQGPVLQGVYGRPVQLKNERSIVADEQYLLESILYPQAKLVAGYPAIMPTYKGQLSDEALAQLVAYLKSLGRQAPRAAPGSAQAAEAAEPGRAPTATPAAAALDGAQLFTQLACNTCHRVDPAADVPTMGPQLFGIYGSQVALQDGTTVTADEAYLRTSILHAQDQLVAGFAPIMPAYEGQISGDEVDRLVAYLKTLR